MKKLLHEIDEKKYALSTNLLPVPVDSSLLSG